MIKTQSVLTTVAGVTTVGVMFLTSSAAEALTLTGGFGFSGTANLNPEVGVTNPAIVTATFTQRFFDQASGSFLAVSPPAMMDPGNTFPFTANPINFVNIGGSLYGGELFTIDFGTQTIGGITDTLTVRVNPSVFLRNSSASSSSLVPIEQIGATATFNGMDTLLDGSYSINDTQSNDGTFNLSFTAVSVSVPEPSANVTFLALGMLGIGLMVKRKLTHRF